MQYRLRTLFIAVTVFAVVCAWLKHEYRVVQERTAMRQRIEYYEGRLSEEDEQNVSTAQEPSIVRRLMGDRTVKVIHFPQDQIREDDLRRIKECFPGAAITLGPPETTFDPPVFHMTDPFPELRAGFTLQDP